MKIESHINSLTSQSLLNGATFRVALDEFPEERGFWHEFEELEKEGGGWYMTSLWYDLKESATRKKESSSSSDRKSTVLNGTFTHFYVQMGDSAPEGYVKVKEKDQYSYPVWRREYGVKELLLSEWSRLLQQVAKFKDLKKKFTALVRKIPHVQPSSENDLAELALHAIPWAERALDSINRGRYPEKPLRPFVTMDESIDEFDGWNLLIPKADKIVLMTSFPVKVVAEDVVERIQSAGVASPAKWNHICSTYKVEQEALFQRGINDGKMLYRQNKLRADFGSTDGTQPLGSFPISSNHPITRSAYDVGLARGFTAARDRFESKLKAGYLRKGANADVAEKLAQWASRPNSTENLAGWFEMATLLLRGGVSIVTVERLKTKTIPLDPGCTYRHRALIGCSPDDAEKALGCQSSEQVAGQGGRLVRAIFGSSPDSKAGFLITPSGVEVYADQ